MKGLSKNLHHLSARRQSRNMCNTADESLYAVPMVYYVYVNKEDQAWK